MMNKGGGLNKSRSYCRNIVRSKSNNWSRSICWRGGRSQRRVKARPEDQEKGQEHEQKQEKNQKEKKKDAEALRNKEWNMNRNRNRNKSTNWSRI